MKRKLFEKKKTMDSNQHSPIKENIDSSDICDGDVYRRYD